MSGILRLLNIREEEKQVALGLFFFSFVIGIARVFCLTSSQAIFLKNYDAGDLAYVYVIASVATIAVSTGYLRLSRIIAPRSLISVTLMFVLGFTLLIRIGLALSGVRWPAMALSVWFYVLFPLTNLAFWGTATKLVDIRQGKRLFTLVATGDVLAFSFGGFAILRLVRAVGPPNLLMVSAGGTLLAIATFHYLVRTNQGSLGTVDPGARPGRPKKPVTWSNPYLRLMIGYFALSAVVYVFVDNAFNDVAQSKYGDVDALARFFGTYSAVTAIVNFLFRSLVAGRLIGRFGVTAGLLGVPAMVLIGASTVALTGSVAIQGACGLVFWLMTLTRMSDKVFRGVQGSSLATLYQPLGDRAPAVQATMEGIVDAAALGGSGLVLLGLQAFFDVGAVLLAFFLVVLCLIWIGVSVGLKREYTGILANALHRRRISPSSFTMTDDVVGLVTEQLNSPYPENVVYALGLIEESDHETLPAVLVRLLEHPSDRVRREALRRIEKYRVEAALAPIGKIVRDGSASEELRGEAMRVLCVLGETPEGLEALNHEVTGVRKGALVGMLRSGSIEGVVHAGARLLEEIESQETDRRVFAAEVLAEAGISGFHRQSLQLLDDPDPRVRCSGLVAAGRIGSPEAWPRIVASLSDPKLTAVATQVLIQGGSAAIDSLVEGFSRVAAGQHPRLGILRILGLIRGSRAAEQLFKLTSLEDPEERHAAMVALAGCPFEAEQHHCRRIEELLRREIRDATLRFVVVAAVGDQGKAALLVSSLDYEISLIRHRIFLLLSFLYPSSEAIVAWDNYSDGDRERKAYAIELVENFASGDLRHLVMPVLDERDIAGRLAHLMEHLPVERGGISEWIQYILSDDHRGFGLWARECARHVATVLQMSAAARSGGSELVRQTLRLGSVELFSEMPQAVLAGIVPKFRPLQIGAGEAVFRKGEVGDCLYVVDRGSVRVEDDGRILSHLCENTVFGEFTVLQSAPRTASVIAEQTTRLLRFEQADLFRLIAEQVSVARSMIQLILRRLVENRVTVNGRERVSRISISLKPLK
ncbi:MAG: cyclic nucleotide-binding domain-containing protein [Gemmatimonadales bacterium]